jgi:hypothetical protein
VARGAPAAYGKAAFGHKKAAGTAPAVKNTVTFLRYTALGLKWLEI